MEFSAGGESRKTKSTNRTNRPKMPGTTDSPNDFNYSETTRNKSDDFMTGPSVDESESTDQGSQGRVDSDNIFCESGVVMVARKHRHADRETRGRVDQGLGKIDDGERVSSFSTTMQAPAKNYASTKMNITHQHVEPRAAKNYVSTKTNITHQRIKPRATVAEQAPRSKPSDRDSLLQLTPLCKSTPTEMSNLIVLGVEEDEDVLEESAAISMKDEEAIKQALDVVEARTSTLEKTTSDFVTMQQFDRERMDRAERRMDKADAERVEDKKMIADLEEQVRNMQQQLTALCHTFGDGMNKADLQLSEECEMDTLRPKLNLQILKQAATDRDSAKLGEQLHVANERLDSQVREQQSASKTTFFDGKRKTKVNAKHSENATDVVNETVSTLVANAAYQDEAEPEVAENFLALHKFLRRFPLDCIKLKEKCGICQLFCLFKCRFHEIVYDEDIDDAVTTTGDNHRHSLSLLELQALHAVVRGAAVIWMNNPETHWNRIAWYETLKRDLALKRSELDEHVNNLQTHGECTCGLGPDCPIQQVAQYWDADDDKNFVAEVTAAANKKLTLPGDRNLMNGGVDAAAGDSNLIALTKLWPSLPLGPGNWRSYTGKELSSAARDRYSQPIFVLFSKRPEYLAKLPTYELKDLSTSVSELTILELRALIAFLERYAFVWKFDKDANSDRLDWYETLKHTLDEKLTIDASETHEHLQMDIGSSRGRAREYHLHPSAVGALDCLNECLSASAKASAAPTSRLCAMTNMTAVETGFSNDSDTTVAGELTSAASEAKMIGANISVSICAPEPAIRKLFRPTPMRNDHDNFASPTTTARAQSGSTDSLQKDGDYRNQALSNSVNLSNSSVKGLFSISRRAGSHETDLILPISHEKAEYAPSNMDASFETLTHFVDAVESKYVLHETWLCN
ncbi:hypothetical protein MPSEU_000349200 [Mayamaea pseudoterrestris]|nr:hypothetical protein MPSEU_000349200 [Mayamaea pseudoterrestris]